MFDRLLALSIFGLSVLVGSILSAEAPETELQFNRDIRPILSNHCFHCHGPDESTREAGLRLDRREELLKLHDGKAILVPGKPEQSELVARITSTDEFVQMPPPSAEKPLSAKQIELLKRWIAQGGEWQDHWSLVPPNRPEVPEVSSKWPQNSIDRFVLNRMQARSFQPAEETDKRTLIRRLYFDLHGLPPTAAEVEAFLQDDSADAYDRLVDKLLSSPHFGERMATYWLDLVRFADTNGIHGDNPRPMDLFRDYVIDSFNKNKPYDQFTIEQLAGDLLPEPTLETKIASGYNRLLMTTREGGAQPKEYMAKYAADRVRNASSVWLGLTLGCAECHDHKFDPLTQRDFYSFAAFFADVKETAVGSQRHNLTVPDEEQKQQIDQINSQIQTLQQEIAGADLSAAQAAWEKRIGKEGSSQLAEPSKVISENGATLAVQKDGSILAKGKNPDKDRYRVQFAGPVQDVTGVRLEILPHPSLPAKGPGRAGNGNFVLHQIELNVADKKVPFTLAKASHSQSGFGIESTIDDSNSTGWAILPKTGQANSATFELAENLTTTKDQTVEISLSQQYGSRHTLGHFRIVLTTEPRPLQPEGMSKVPQNLLAILKVSPSERNEQQRKTLTDFYRTIAPELESQRQRIAKLQQQREAIENTFRKTLITEATSPRMIRVLPRGNWLDDSGPVVEPAVPAVLPKLAVAGRRANRLDLATWMVDPEHPLVARVFVNRLWTLMFGEGIARSLDDFGSQGHWPTHPALLDWLAVEFVESGWDVKHMVKLIVMSQTYRQSSNVGSDLRNQDPYNQWLARQNAFRLDAEFVRDNALSISGLLSSNVGGASVKPYQPAGYWSHLNFPRREYQQDAGEKLYRRGLYTFWQRTFLHPSLRAFDAPTREECTVQRPRSNTPLQALVLLNDPIYVEAAKAFAVRLLKSDSSTLAERLEFAYREALGRGITPAEEKLLSELYRKHVADYQRDEAAARELLSIGEFKVPEDLPLAELAAYTSIARVILNLHETITRY